MIDVSHIKYTFYSNEMMRFVWLHVWLQDFNLFAISVKVMVQEIINNVSCFQKLWWLTRGQSDIKGLLQVSGEFSLYSSTGEGEVNIWMRIYLHSWQVHGIPYVLVSQRPSACAGALGIFLGFKDYYWPGGLRDCVFLICTFTSCILFGEILTKINMIINMNSHDNSHQDTHLKSVF